MSVLYRPVLIESAEQAEALPLGAVALGPFHQAATRVDFGLGWSVTGDAMSDHHEEIVGWTALVPVAIAKTKASPDGTRYTTEEF